MTSDVDVSVWGPGVDGVSGIERELSRVRRGRAAHGREQVATLARAAVVNIVVIATREVHALRASRTARMLAMRHPSRAIVVLADRQPEGVAPSITLHTQLPPADQLDRVSYEQILVRARGDVSDRLTTVLVPLLVPDLPLFLWWTGTPPVGQRHFEELVALADRLVVDSADFARPELMLPQLGGLCFVGTKHCALTDLNWARLTPWRELITQDFDVPAWRSWLDAIVGFRAGFAVDADGRDIHPSQALLLIAWFASRLGWRASEPLAPSEAGGHLFAMTRPDGERVRIRVRPRFERGMVEGDVSGVRIQARRADRTAEFYLSGYDRPGYATAVVRMDGAVVSERIVPLIRPDVVGLLEEELTILASDRIYEEALALLLTLS